MLNRKYITYYENKNDSKLVLNIKENIINKIILNNRYLTIYYNYI